MCAFQGQSAIETDGSSAPRVTQTSRALPTSDPDEISKVNQRIVSYTNWNGKKSPMQLATAGFVYTGVGDKVECQSCGIRLYNWQDEEDPLHAHKKYAPDCEFMKKHFPQMKPAPKPKKITHVKYPSYSDYQARFKSFDSWPLKCVAQKPEIMAKSGFFYIGSADRARCFYCGVTLRDWDTDDYPPCAHKQWSENCPFVQQLDVEGLKAEIEELERQEKIKEIFQTSDFHNCSSSLRTPSSYDYQDVVVDGVVDDHASSQIHAQVSDKSTDCFAFNPAIQAVVEMGYSNALIEKALEIRRREGDANPNAVSIMDTIFAIEG